MRARATATESASSDGVAATAIDGAALLLHGAFGSDDDTLRQTNTEDRTETAGGISERRYGEEVAFSTDRCMVAVIIIGRGQQQRR